MADLATLKIAVDTTQLADATKKLGEFAAASANAEKNIVRQTKTATAEAAAIHKQAGIILLQDWKQRGALEAAIHKQTGTVLLDQWKQRGAAEKAIHKQQGDELLMQYKQRGAQEAAIHKQAGDVLLQQHRERITQRQIMEKRDMELQRARWAAEAKIPAESLGILDKYTHQFKRTLLDLTPIISGLGLLTLAHGAIQATDQYTKLTSQLKNATNSTAEYATAMSEVKRISSAAQVDIGAIGSLYQRLSLALQASGTSQKEIALITETVSLGLKANGASARESASAMLQLSQSFGSGRMAGEEFNSMAEAAPNILRALATSMGVPYGALKGLAAEGKITTEVMARAFTDPALLESFRTQAASMRTITGSWVELTNALVLYVGQTSKTSGVVSVISGALSFLADNLKIVADAVVIAALAISGKLAVAIYGSISAFIKMNIVQGEALAMNIIYAKTTEEKAAAQVLFNASLNSGLGIMQKIGSFAKANALGLIGLVLWGAYEIADYMGWIDQIFNKTKVEMENLNKLAGQDEGLKGAIGRAIEYVKKQQDAIAAQKAQREEYSKMGIAFSTDADTFGKAVDSRIKQLEMMTKAGASMGGNVPQMKEWLDVLRQIKVEMAKPAEFDFSMGSSKEFKKLEELYGTAEFKRKEHEVKKQAIIKAGFDAGVEMTIAYMKSVESIESAMAAKSRVMANKLLSDDSRAGFIEAINAKLEKELGNQKKYSDEAVRITQSTNEQISLLGEKYKPKKEKEHQSAMLTMATELEAKIKSDNEALSNSERVSLAWTKLKDSEKTAAEELNYVKAQSAAIALDEIVAYDKNIQAIDKIGKSIETETESLYKKLEAEKEELAMIGLTKEGIALLEAERYKDTITSKEALASLYDEIPGLEAKATAIREQIKLMKELRGVSGKKADAIAADEVIKAETKAYEDQWKMIDGFAHDAFDNIFDKGKNAFEEIGKVIKKSILDMLYKMTVQKWIIPVSITGGVAASGMAGAATGSYGGGTGLMDIASSGLSMAMSGLTASQALGAASAYGSAALSATSLAEGISMATSGLSLAMPYIGAAVAAVSVLGRLFGGKGPSITGSGVMARYDANGQQIGATGIESGVTQGALDQTQSLETAYLRAAMSLGIGTVATQFNWGTISSGTHFSAASSAGGKVWEQAGIASGDANTQLAASRAIFNALQGSDLPQYLARMFDGLTAGSMTQQDIDNTLAFAGSVKQMREALLETRAPLEVLRANVDAGTAAFATSAATFRTDFVTAIDAGINQQVFEQWKALGTAIDQLAAADAEAAARAAEETARASEVAAKALADALKLITTSLEQALGDAKNILSASIDAEKSSLQVQYEAQLTIARTRIDSVSASVSKLTDLSSLLRTTVTSMAVGVTRQTAQAQISAALAAARTGGVLPSAESLQDSIRKVSEPSQQMFGSYVDYMRDFVKTSNDISALADLTDVQLTEQQQSLAIAEQQLEVLTLNYDASIARLDGIWEEATGIKYAVLDVATALANFQSATGAVSAAPQVQALINKEVAIGQAGGITAETYNAMAVTSVASQLEKSIADMYGSILGRAADVSGMSYWATSGMSLVDIESQIAASSEAQARAISVGAQNTMIEAVNAALGTTTNIRAYADGSNYIGYDQLAMLHQGETVTPSAYVDRDRAAREETNALLKRLQEEVSKLREENKAGQVAIARNTNRSAKVLEQFDGDGLPAERVI